MQQHFERFVPRSSFVVGQRQDRLQPGGQLLEVAASRIDPRFVGEVLSARLVEAVGARAVSESTPAAVS